MGRLRLRAPRSRRSAGRSLRGRDPDPDRRVPRVEDEELALLTSVNPKEVNMDTIERELLDDFDIAAINAARSVLTEIQERCQGYKPSPEAGKGWLRESLIRDAGNVWGQAEALEHGLFQLLNFSKHHLAISMTDDQLHNRTPESDC